MMKAIVILALFALAVAEDYYVTLDDHLDVEKLFTDLNKVQVFLDCFFDKAPCSDLALSYKKHVPEAVREACKKCNSAQKHIFWKSLKALKAALPKEYDNFRQKYDPDNKYFDALEQEISKY